MSKNRKSGVLMHISSLWGDYSCGSFGRAGYEFVDFLADSGFSFWQVLPFCMPDEDASPYNSFSTFSVNPYFIDLERLSENGLLTRSELEEAKQRTPYVAEFKRLAKERFDLLAKAAARSGDGEATEEFFRKNPHTENFCRYMARRAKNGGESFRLWTDDGFDETVYKTWRFICFAFIKQWSELKKYANGKGISIIGDIPIYVSDESSDVQEQPDQFLLDERYMPTKVAGVPPDYFSEDGQLWGNPLYDWKRMAEDGFKWWRERIGFMCELFDCVRIDHFRGIESFYTCDPDAENAKNGRWVKGPGMALINAIKEAAGDRMLIAEDLGIITPEVEKLVRDSGFPGMRVLEFGFAEGTDNPHLPHNYEKNTVVYTGTHDNNTLLGYVWELDGATRRRLLDYCGYTGQDWNSREAYTSVIRTMLESHADTVIFPLQDLLLYGADTRMNTPGVKEGNWAWRVTRDALSGVDRGELRRMNALYGRCR